jgi:hypothetical protein
MPVVFKDVHDILDDAIKAWTDANGAPDLSGHNTGSAPMVWATKAELLAAWGHGRRLIQPEVIGNGKGATANLVIDLKTGFGNPPRRMPNGGPYLNDADINTIIAWIDAGCPD